jgi:FMNH2-dependent dimethyl sulfone monooxygenase
MLEVSSPASPANGRSPLQRIAEQPLMLGLFLPIQSGGWTPSLAPRDTSWTFDYNARLAVRADELGFDLVFGLAQWLGKGGYGGTMRYREIGLDPMITTAALAPLTKNIVLISTVHVIYHWHPLHLAKIGATIDHMSNGRWGVNIVTGYRPAESAMFGLPQPDHDTRYAMASEFLGAMQRLWDSDENVTFAGKYYRMRDAFVTPKPVNGRPIIVNASTSPAGLDFAARHSDILFITSPAGAEIEAAIDALHAHNRHIREQAAQHGRTVRTIVNPHVICRETEREARADYAAMLRQEDTQAVDNLMGSFTHGDTLSFRGHKRSQRVVGGNVQLVGTPEQVVDWFVRLKAAGCDGVQLNFFDFLPDLEFFGARVMPLMREAGLRIA